MAACPDPEFSVEVLSTGARSHVVVRGDVDLVTADELAAGIDAELERGSDVVLDLGRVSFIDSSGVAVLLDTMATAKRRGWRFAIDPHLSPAVEHVFAITAILPKLPLADR